MWNKYIACHETNNYALCVGVKSQCYIYLLELVCQFSLYSEFFSFSFGEKDFICFNVIPVVYSFHLGCKTCLLSKIILFSIQLHLPIGLQECN